MTSRTNPGAVCEETLAPPERELLKAARELLDTPLRSVTPLESPPEPWRWPGEAALQAEAAVLLWPDRAGQLAASLLAEAPLQSEYDHSRARAAAHTARALAAIHRASPVQDVLATAYSHLEERLLDTWRYRNFVDEMGLWSWARPDEAPPWSSRCSGPINFACVDLSCCLAREAEAMAFLAGELGRGEEAQAWTARFREAFEGANYHLWDDGRRLYMDHDWGGNSCGPLGAHCLLPLWAGLAPASRAPDLVRALLDPERFWSACPLPAFLSDDASSPARPEGAVMWPVYNLWLVEGLRRYGETEAADKLRRRTLGCLANGLEQTAALWDCYDAQGHAAPGDLQGNQQGSRVTAAVATLLLATPA